MSDEETDDSERTTNVSRRGFLLTAAAGAAGAGIAVTVPPALTGSPIPWASWFGPSPDHAGGEPIVAYLGDVRKGEIVLMAGTREVRVRDFGIVSWMVRALSGA